MTIRELAKLAGVSRTTVSRALNNASEVSKGTRDRILLLAAEHGYQANPMLTALMSDVRKNRVRSRKTILAIVYPDFQIRKWGTGYLAHQRFRLGVEDRAKQLGFDVQDFRPADYGNSYRRLSEVLEHRGINAVLVPSIDEPKRPKTYDYFLNWDRFSAAAIGFSLKKPENIDRAIPSQFRSAQLAFRKVYEKGYRRIALCTRASVNERTGRRWKAAYLLFQDEIADVAKIPAFEYRANEGEESLFRKWFDKYQPEAIVGDRNSYRLVLNNGLRAPQDLAYAQLDLVLGVHDKEGLGGIDQRFEKVGSATVDLISGRLNRNERGLPDVPKLLKIAGIWVDGPSVPDIS